MTRALPFVVFGMFLAATSLTAAEKDGIAVEGPLLIAQAPPKPETKKYDLRYKLSRGDVLRYQVDDRASYTTTIEQTTDATQSKTITTKALKVTDVLPTGDIEFLTVLQRVQMVNQLPNHSPVEYDSQRDKTPPLGFENVAKTIGAPLVSIRMTPRGKILNREWKAKTPKQDEGSPAVVRLPEQPVAIGETWDEPADIKAPLQDGGAKVVQTRRHHKLTAVEKDVATIEVTNQVLTPVDAYTEYQIVQRLWQGEVQFDIAAGRVINQRMNIDKRILGFAGPTSTTQYVQKIEEKLLQDAPKTAAKPATPKSNTGSKAKTKSSTRTIVNNRNQPARPTQTANRPKPTTQQQPKTYRR
jgi:hypothetical protein